MPFVPVILLAVALSADSMATGLAYGMRRIRMPWWSLAIISCTSMTAIALSMLAGHQIAACFDPHLASRLGAVLIIFLGFWIALQRAGEHATADNPTIVSINIRPLGIIIQILKHPEKADFDLSGTINIKESLYLGFALAIDSLGVGLGASMAGYPVLFTVAALGVVNFLMVTLGLNTGRCVSHSRVNYTTACLSGLILMVVGILRLF